MTYFIKMTNFLAGSCRKAKVPGLLLAGLLAVGPWGATACGGKSSSSTDVTGIKVIVRFDAEEFSMDRFRIEGRLTSDNSQAFAPGMLPDVPAGPLAGPEQSFVVLLPDAMGGQEVEVTVWGLDGDQEVAFGKATLVCETGTIVEAVVELGEAPICGDGKVQASEETCDTAIPEGQAGACPTDCDDQDPCTTDTLEGAGTCQAMCHNEPITQCAHGDGCCPSGCGPSDDSDCQAICGDGLVSTGETCDTGIQPGNPGACPTTCEDDGNLCTSDSLRSPGTCQALCSHEVITQFVGGDGCCPQGGDATLDSDCLAVCGNAILEPGEECDTGIAQGQQGACPGSCEDSDPCTQDQLIDNGPCQSHCLHQSITQFIDGDGCCPQGGDATLDSDCQAVCGNGVLEPGEECDTAILPSEYGGCPRQDSDCNDQISCTQDTLANAGTCNATCQHSPITTCTAGDGCCPDGCTLANDTDCDVVCGDGVVTTPQETCDTAIASGNTGACPTLADCVDNDLCTEDTLAGDGTCQAYCDHSFVGCVDGDGCCDTSQCNNNTDGDCPAVCGNGVVESAGGELCDTGIASGDPGACPTSCDDGDACTQDTLQGAGSCQATCTYNQITRCDDGSDGCCPSGCTLQDDGDKDCPGCGNCLLESNLGEECDDCNVDNLDGCTTSCTTQTGAVGDPCALDNNCDSGLRCETDGLPGGYCTKLNCNVQTSCPSGSLCKDNLDIGNFSTGFCVELCTTDTDCRWNEGYRCSDIGNGQKGCLPPD